jgi:hypothetical protein
MNSGDDVTIWVWWTPQCGAMHVDKNPVSIFWVCPDGLKADWWKDDGPTR